MPKTTTPAVKALIENDSRFLTIQTEDSSTEEDYLRWGLPGGRIEYGESPQEALRREVREEVSIDIEIHETIDVFHFYWKNMEIVPTVFLCSPKGKASIESAKSNFQNIVNYDWVRPEEFLEREALEELKKLVKDFYKTE